MDDFYLQYHDRVQPSEFHDFESYVEDRSHEALSGCTAEIIVRVTDREGLTREIYVPELELLDNGIHYTEHTVFNKDRPLGFLRDVLGTSVLGVVFVGQPIDSMDRGWTHQVRDVGPEEPSLDTTQHIRKTNG